MKTVAVDKFLATTYGENAYKIVEKLTDAGFDTWWVGGCVRDLLQGKMPTDIDIATAATPDDIRKLFTKAIEDVKGLASLRVLEGQHAFELTTFREDDEASDGRHPERIVFSDREHDAKRRDFTVNAIYYNPISRELYDPFGGAADVKERLIEFIGDPVTRIKHDALRILRAVRLRATLDGQYHPDTYAALRENAGLVDGLSGMRQLQELEKMLACPHPACALEDLWELQILQCIAPEIAVNKGIPQPADYHHEGDVWDHLLQCASSFREDDGPDVRLAALFHDIGKAETFSQKERIRFDHHASVSADLATAILKRLGAASKRIEKIDWLIRHHMMMGTFESMDDERKSHWYFHPWFPELLKVFWLDIAGTTPAEFGLYDSIVRDYQSFLDTNPRPAKPLLTGEDVMKILGMSPGEQVGKLLKDLQKRQISKDITTKKEAIAYLETLKSTK